MPLPIGRSAREHEKGRRVPALPWDDAIELGRRQVRLNMGPPAAIRNPFEAVSGYSVCGLAMAL